MIVCLQRVKKVFFDTLETVEKATKPSEPHSSAYRGTAECGSRRKSKCSIVNSFKLIPNQKPKEKLQVTERLFCEQCSALTVRGVFRQSEGGMINPALFIFNYKISLRISEFTQAGLADK